MFWVMIGLIVVAIIGWIIFGIHRDFKDDEFVAGIGLIVIVWAMMFMIYVPIVTSIDWEYEEGQKAEEYELVSLHDEVATVGKGNRWYISMCAENSYTYYVETEVPASYGEGTAYESYTISGENVFIMEDDKYIDNAKLVKYVCKPKNKFWTCMLVEDKIEYVFYVPEGSIVKNISLN